jgi:ABC-type antimicrobial peptide transport system permease subunit
VGWIVSGIVTRLNDWPTVNTFGSAIFALICSIAVGIFFGYYPARRAADLDPIDALRSV